EIRFRNAPAVSEGHLVKVAIFMVKNAHRSVVTQTSLHQVAVRVINFVTPVAQISPAAGRGRKNRKKNEAELLHVVQSDNSQKSATAFAQSQAKNCRIVLKFPATT